MSTSPSRLLVLLPLLAAGACTAPPEYARSDAHARSVAVEFDNESTPSGSSFVVLTKQPGPAGEETPAAPLPEAKPAEPPLPEPDLGVDGMMISTCSRERTTPSTTRPEVLFCTRMRWFNAPSVSAVPDMLTLMPPLPTAIVTV